MLDLTSTGHSFRPMLLSAVCCLENICYSLGHGSPLDLSLTAVEFSPCGACHLRALDWGSKTSGSCNFRASDHRLSLSLPLPLYHPHNRASGVLFMHHAVPGVMGVGGRWEWGLNNTDRSFFRPWGGRKQTLITRAALGPNVACGLARWIRATARSRRYNERVCVADLCSRVGRKAPHVRTEERKLKNL